MTATKTKYREWIKKRYGSIHQEETEEKYATRKWKINQNNIRDTFMDEYVSSGYKPAYMVTRSYYYEQNNIKEVKEDNKRMNDVLDDFLNPRLSNDYYISKNHFIEQHKDKLVKKSKRPVLNTIIKEWELDWDGSSVEIQKGGFHVHSLFSEIDDNVVLNPNGKIRKSIEKIYGLDTIPIILLESDEGLTKVKTDLLEYAIRKRCDFVGKGQLSLDIQASSEYGSFDGYRGWKGMVAYCTKTMYNVDNIVQVYDYDNSDILDIS
jgi:hypothetical protein